MFKLLQFNLFLLLFCKSSIATVIEIPVEKDVLDMSRAIANGQAFTNVTDFSHPDCQRDIVEFILVQVALEKAGFPHKFKFLPGNVDARNLRLLQNGLLLISFDSLWLSQTAYFADDVFVSEPIIRRGEYLAGVFVAAKNVTNYKVKNLQHLRQLSFVSSKDWYVDWKTLSRISPAGLTHEVDWISMAKLVDKGWVDAMLISFKGSYPFRYRGSDYDLVALEGIKVALDDSRHFVISKKHPKGQETFDALQLGLQLLRKEGIINNAYRQCGFFNDEISDWTLINPAE